MMNIRQMMIDMAAERREKIKHIIADELPDIFTLNDDYTYLGSFSWMVRTKNERIMQRGGLLKVSDFYQTPSEISRDSLKVKYTKTRRLHRTQLSVVNAHRSPPLWAVRGVYPDMVYVDLRAAYWSILWVGGWDVDYFPSRWIGAGGSMADFPYPNLKMVRNMLVSAGIMSSVTTWEYGNLHHRRSYNPLLNTSLWAFAQDVLTAIALEMLSIGAVYVHTDGYILPLARLQDAFSIIDDWQLNGSVKFVGDAVIYGAGRYEMPKSRRLNDFEKNGTNTYNLHSVDTDFLKPRFKRLARARVKNEGIIP